VHVCVDDASRLAYVEVLPDERRERAVAFLERASAWYRSRGIAVERVMTDRQRLSLEPVRARVPSARAPAPAHPALPTAHQRQGRAFHPDTAARVGLRPPLSRQRQALGGATGMAEVLQLQPSARQLGRKPPGACLDELNNVARDDT
jgi:hypothetical protein